MSRDEMRAGDADRQAVADQLRTALEEGRLDLHEYDERLQRVYAAKTYGDLGGLLADLPGGQVPQPSSPGPAQPVWPGPAQPVWPGPAQPVWPGPAQPVWPGPAQPAGAGVVQPAGVGDGAVRPAAKDRAKEQWLAALWGPWLFTVTICTAVWGVSSLASFEPLYFWPLWVAVPWGFILVLLTVGGLAAGVPGKIAEAQDRKVLVKEHRRQRRALIAQAIARGELPEDPTKQQRRAFFQQAIARGELSPKPDKS